MQTGEKFVVTVYCDKKTGRYSLADSSVNFVDCIIGIPYRILVDRNNKGSVFLMKAGSVDTIGTLKSL